MNQPYNYVALKKICNFEKGATGISKAVPGDYPLVTTGPERRSHNSCQFDAKAVCIPLVSSTGHGHASLNYVHYQEGKFALGTILVALTAKDDDVLDIKFLHLYLSHLKDSVLVPLMSGAANVSLSVDKIKNIKVPLPPLKIQREIICRVNSIVTEDAFLKQELAHQQTLLKKLRQQILQEAVEGKLTADWRAQNPDVEPASELLARIQAEKVQLVKAKKINKQKPLPPISEEEKPFVLPDGWKWCRLGDLIYENPRNGYSPKSVDFPTETKTLKLGATSTGKFIETEIKYLNESIGKESFLWLNNRDILIQRANSIDFVGVSAIYYGDRYKFIYPDLMMKIKPVIFIHEQYLHYVLMSPSGRQYFRDNATGAQKSMPKINQGIVSNTLISLPPLSEQKAIVAKVEKLLSLCDQLGHEISQNQCHAEQLMQAVLSEAFSQPSKQTTQPAAVPVKRVMKQDGLFLRQPTAPAQIFPLLLQTEQQGFSTESPSFPYSSL